VYILAALLSVVLILFILVDGFEAMILPRRVTRPYRFARLYYQLTWRLWRLAAGLIRPGKGRETFLSMFGPLSLLGLFAIWVLGLIVGFAVLQWSLGVPLQGALEDKASLGAYLYLSGTTYFTLGLGDLTPLSPLGRFLTVIEAGLGFGFLACVISYLPVLYQSFSRREVTISLLDARAGSPPSASELLLRLAQARNMAALASFLAEWERWSAEVLESQLSYPSLSYYRSQHDNQSWLAALTSVLDACAVVIAGVKDMDPYQAQLTFAMARHAVVDLALVFRLPPRPPDPPRLTTAQLAKLRVLLGEAGLSLREEPAMQAKLTQLREMYEPFVSALAHFLFLTLPPFVREQNAVDNWQTTAWTRRAPGFSRLASLEGDEHFD
jgi:Ion channel